MKSLLNFVQTLFDSIAWFIGCIVLTGCFCAGILGTYIIVVDWIENIKFNKKDC